MFVGNNSVVQFNSTFKFCFLKGLTHVFFKGNSNSYDKARLSKYK